jgi:hypothetical protein
MCTKDELMDGLDRCFPTDMKRELINQCYTQYEILKERKADAEKFVNDVYDASLCQSVRMIKNVVEEKGREYARDARQDKLEETKGIQLDNEFSKLDKEHDGILTFEQFDQLLDVYGLNELKENSRIQLKNFFD